MSRLLGGEEGRAPLLGVFLEDDVCSLCSMPSMKHMWDAKALQSLETLLQ